MKIAVLGTGFAGRTLAGALSTLGHDVVVGTRDPGKTLARSAPDAMCTPPFSEWHVANQHIALETFAEAAAGAELILSATNGADALTALGAAGSADLSGKVGTEMMLPVWLRACGRRLGPRISISRSSADVRRGSGGDRRNI
jgi:predicted dinucleotide-binding enzyme